MLLSHGRHTSHVKGGMLEKLMPKSDEFFDDFDAQAEVTVRGAKLLRDLFENFTDIERKVAAIKQVEHEGDDIAHRAFERLHRLLVPATEKMREAVRLLREIKNPAQILAACREIKTIEGDADALTRTAIAALFKSGADTLSI